MPHADRGVVLLCANHGVSSCCLYAHSSTGACSSAAISSSVMAPSRTSSTSNTSAIHSSRTTDYTNDVRQVERAADIVLHGCVCRGLAGKELQ